ncbi:MAG: MBL fold metallo-hydrolase [Rhodobacteraceae bacterium]|nr:MBL fold metallo-hydrolase [Paracoccaceae bacterium]
MSLTHSRQVGEIEVIAITDGARVFDTGVFANTTDAHVADLLAAAGKPEIITNFNAFLLRRGDVTMLVDTGTRGLFGPETGKLMEGLDSIGVAPADVTHLFITHLHPDHAAGAITPEGAAIFPQAELILAESERSFWADEANFTGADETLSGWRTLAAAVLSAYGEQLKVVEDVAEIMPGVSVVGLPGHTPGHAGFRIDSGGEALVHVGDLVHAQDLQLTDPEVGVVFDIDPDQARETRKRLLDMLATDGIALTGGHILAPKFGRVEHSGGGYRFVAL